MKSVKYQCQYMIMKKILHFETLTNDKFGCTCCHSMNYSFNDFQFKPSPWLQKTPHEIPMFGNSPRISTKAKAQNKQKCIWYRRCFKILKLGKQYQIANLWIIQMINITASIKISYLLTEMKKIMICKKNWLKP